MTTSMRLLPVRTTAGLRRLIEGVGPINAATRALIILGADRANLDLCGFEREIALLLSELLDEQVSAALRAVYHRLLNEVPAESAMVMPEPTAEGTDHLSKQQRSTADEPSDPFATVGMEV